MFITFVLLKLRTPKCINYKTTKHEFMTCHKTRFIEFMHIQNYNINLRTSNVYKHTLVKVIKHNMSSINVIIYNTS